MFPSLKGLCKMEMSLRCLSQDLETRGGMMAEPIVFSPVSSYCSYLIFSSVTLATQPPIQA
jgi:hypothetical protein